MERIANRSFDVCVIAGGATGSGCALDAQLRGLSTVLIEAHDFASGSSSASTKMVHGGVRYLQEAVSDLDIHQYRLVEHALHERAIMLRNAPHLTRTMEFLVPCFSRFEKLYYGIGMRLYDWIAGRASLLPSRSLSRDEALSRMPAMQPKNLVGATTYADGQFDDARYGLALIETFVTAGGEALNYARAAGFSRDTSGKLAAVAVTDALSGRTFEIRARCFVNATGPLSDAVRQLASAQTTPRMRPSKGVHILFPLDGFSETDALLVPKTEDGRVIFAIPWNGRLLVGTTDTDYTSGDEMVVTRDEIDYLLRQINPYLKSPLSAGQVVSGFAGIRPLVAASGVADTKKLIRDDEVEYDTASGLISILGGKWTTYRRMAEKTIDKVQEVLNTGRTPSRTREHPLTGAAGFSTEYWQTLVGQYRIAPTTAHHLVHKYGTQASEVLKLTEVNAALKQPLVEGVPAIRAQVVYAARSEMAQTLEDVLARRIGLQLYDWRTAICAAPVAAALLARELDWTADQERSAVEEYVGSVNHLLATAGLLNHTNS
jgi:glycerol-3-phosphate dehydrogenase